MLKIAILSLKRLNVRFRTIKFLGSHCDSLADCMVYHPRTLFSVHVASSVSHTLFVVFYRTKLHHSGLEIRIAKDF